MTDTDRLIYVMRDIDGFEGVDADKYEYALDEANHNGRQEPNDADLLEGVRRMIDDAILFTNNEEIADGP